MSTAALAKGIFFFLSQQAVSTRVTGNSMYPALKDGCRIRINPAGGSCAPGDVYIFLHKNTLVAHRYVGPCDGALVFAGDNNLYFETIAPDQIIGQVSFNENGLFRWLIRMANRIVYRLKGPLFLKKTTLRVRRLCEKEI